MVKIEDKTEFKGVEIFLEEEDVRFDRLPSKPQITHQKFCCKKEK